MSTFDKATIERVDTLFRQARVSLIKSHPWWGSLALRLTPVYTDQKSDGSPMPFSATDGVRVYINPTSFEGLNINDRRSVVFHELMHPALGHLWRTEKRTNAVAWNIATDLTIHNISDVEGIPVLSVVEEDIKTTLNTLGFRNRQEFAGQTSEAIYDQLNKKWPKTALGAAAHGGMSGPSGCCQKREKAAGSPQDSAPGEGSEPPDRQLEREWRAAVLEAGIRAGDCSATLKQLIEATGQSRVSWSEHLHEFLNRGMTGDFSWLPVNRRFIHEGTYRPSTQEVEVGEIAMVIDTSGSMSEDELTVAIGECQEFRRMYACTVHLIECDAGVAAYTQYDKGEELPDKWTAHGRGGTSFNPPFEFVEEHGIEPRLLIYFTDGEGACSVPPPNYPVLWVQIPRKRQAEHYASYNPPFGELIKVQIGD